MDQERRSRMVTRDQSEADSRSVEPGDSVGVNKVTEVEDNRAIILPVGGEPTISSLAPCLVLLR